MKKKYLEEGICELELDDLEEATIDSVYACGGGGGTPAWTTMASAAATAQSSYANKNKDDLSAANKNLLAVGESFLENASKFNGGSTGAEQLDFYEGLGTSEPGDIYQYNPGNPNIKYETMQSEREYQKQKIEEERLEQQRREKLINGGDTLNTNEPPDIFRYQRPWIYSSGSSSSLNNYRNS